MQNVPHQCRSLSPLCEKNSHLDFEDPDFGGQLCVLTDIAKLPQKAVLKVICSESDASSTVTVTDTELLSHALARMQSWPDMFLVPLFSYDVENCLETGNAIYQNSEKTLELTRAQKHDILENMAKSSTHSRHTTVIKKWLKLVKLLLPSIPALQNQEVTVGGMARR